MEAPEVLYSRPASFTSQNQLFDWIEHSESSNLNLVHTLTIRLVDVDLMVLLKPLTPSRTHARKNAWSIYQADLGNLQHALRSLPNLTSLTVIPPKFGASYLPKRMYHMFLADTSKHCHKLNHLELHDSEAVMKAVPELSSIRHVKFTAPSETAKNTASRRVSVSSMLTSTSSEDQGFALRIAEYARALQAANDNGREARRASGSKRSAQQAQLGLEPSLPTKRRVSNSRRAAEEVQLDPDVSSSSKRWVSGSKRMAEEPGIEREVVASPKKRPASWHSAGYGSRRRWT